MFDGEVVVFVDAQVAISGGCKFFISDSHAPLCKDTIPKAALLEIRWQR